MASKIKLRQGSKYFVADPNEGDTGYWGQCDLESKATRIDYRVGRRFRQTMLHEIAHALVGVPGEVGCKDGGRL